MAVFSLIFFTSQRLSGLGLFKKHQFKLPAKSLLSPSCICKLEFAQGYFTEFDGGVLLDLLLATAGLVDGEKFSCGHRSSMVSIYVSLKMFEEQPAPIILWSSLVVCWQCSAKILGLYFQESLTLIRLHFHAFCSSLL